jgi:hypothetical protein
MRSHRLLPLALAPLLLLSGCRDKDVRTAATEPVETVATRPPAGQIFVAGSGSAVYKGEHVPLLECRTKNNRPGSVTVEPTTSGEAITSAGDTLRIPAGAVTETTTFTLRRATNQKYLVLQAEASSEDPTFAKDLTLIVVTNGCASFDPNGLLAATWQDGAPALPVSGTWRPADRTLVITTRHLSGYALAVPQRVTTTAEQ